jgi:hypothetical protein
MSAENWGPAGLKVRLECKDQPDTKVCVERLAQPENLEPPDHLK